MQSREKVLRSLNHQQPDGVAFDIGATAVSGMHVACVAELRRYYGLADRPVKVIDPFQMLGEIDAELQAVLGVDIEGVGARNNLFGFANTGWKPFLFQNRLPVLVPEQFMTTEDEVGGLYLYPEGDLQAEPSGYMANGSCYFDALIRQEPLDDERLDPADNLEEFKPLSEDDLDWTTDRLRQARRTGRAVIVNIGGAGLGDIALVPAPFLKKPKGIRDIAEWYISTVSRRDYLQAIFEAQTDMAIRNLAALAAKAGDLVDIVFICGTDFGTQTSTFCSPATFSELYSPYYRKMNRWIHDHTAWKTFKHSCGAVAGFIPLFIEAGFDILNPVQCSAAGMDPAMLKDRYGDQIVFWGGGVDTQRVLPFGTPEDVRRQVEERCRIFNRQGGFVMGAIHNIQMGTPVENIAALVETVRQYS